MDTNHEDIDLNAEPKSRIELDTDAYQEKGQSDMDVTATDKTVQSQDNEPSEAEPPQKEESESEVATPDEAEAVTETELDKLANIYPVMAKEFQLRFHNNPKDAEQLAKFMNKILNGKGSNAEKWTNYINQRCNYGKSKAMIQNKIIPTLAKAFNSKSKYQIELPKQVNDSLTSNVNDSNGVTIAKVVIPDGFNQSAMELGEAAISTTMGYPLINYNSQLIRAILGSGDDRVYLKKLLKALVNKIEGTPAAKALLNIGIGSRKSALNKIINTAATAKGIPMLRKPLKVMGNVLVDNSDDTVVSVIPVDAMGNINMHESVDMTNGCILTEGFLGGKNFIEWAKGNADTSSVNKFGKAVKIPKIYLQQFYTVLSPSGSPGLLQYTSCMTPEDRNEMTHSFEKALMDEIKSSNKNLNEIILQQYIKKSGGIPLFYILVPRTNPKERLYVCDDTTIHGQVCIKSVSGRNKYAYFIPKDIVNALFEAG